MTDYPKVQFVRGHMHTCANTQPSSKRDDRCNCGALDSAGQAIPAPARFDRKAISRAISDPGATEGYKGERTLTEWQTDAVMRVLAGAA